MTEETVVVIGAGPAGLMASAVAAQTKKTILIEKNSAPGKKLLITGKGRCNVTNAAPIDEFVKNVPVNGNFLYSAFYSFTNTDLIDLLSRLGLETKIERGMRVFPQSDKAADVRDALVKQAKENGVELWHQTVHSIRKSGDGFTLMLDGNKTLSCGAVILATGGVSYPNTGSTGDGYEFAKKFGHDIVSPKGSLVPLVTAEKYAAELMGLSLKNVSVRVLCKEKEIYSDFGEMLFTHFGLSGPIILSASSHMTDEKKQYAISIDLKPALDFKTLDNRILRDFEAEKNKDFVNALDALLPKKLIPVIVKLSGIDPRTKINTVTREQRHALVTLIKDFRFTITGKRPVSEAIVTSGGVNVKEVNPASMESKIVPGLFFAGELLDVDAYTGGFNLQIAFSTGYLAGINAGK